MDKTMPILWEFEEDEGGEPYRIGDSPWYQGSIIVGDAAVADIRQRDHRDSRTSEEARAIGYKIARAVNAYDALVEALGAIEAHHVEQNRIKGRDEAHSTTLRLARAALAKAHADG